MTRMAAGHEGREAGSSAQQSLPLLHPAVLCGPYNLQLKPFPRDQNSHTAWCWITFSLVMLQDGLYPSNQVKPCTERFIRCFAVQLLQQGGSSQDLTPNVSLLSNSRWVLEKKRATRKHLNFFNVLQRGKKKTCKKKGHATTLQCSVFHRWKKKKNKQSNPVGMDRTTTQLF